MYARLPSHSLLANAHLIVIQQCCSLADDSECMGSQKSLVTESGNWDHHRMCNNGLLLIHRYATLWQLQSW